MTGISLSSIHTNEKLYYSNNINTKKKKKKKQKRE
jgi:hypothetical protein